jgi:type I restriction enzyme R subunit
VVKLLRDTLGYDYLGDWIDREINSNIETDLVEKYLRQERGYEDSLTARTAQVKLTVQTVQG